MQDSIDTREGTVQFPAYLPVTTFGEKYPLDDLVRPYLPRLAPGVMVSYHYAREMDTEERPKVPLFVDSGGYGLVKIEEAEVVERRGLGQIEVPGDENNQRVHPREVLDLQEKIAEVAFTLDFPIPEDTTGAEAERRRDLSIANARWALRNRRRHDMPLFASLQGWDVSSYRASAEALSDHEFEGFGIGGLASGGGDESFVKAVVAETRAAIGERPLHVFGIGKPDRAEMAFEAGATSVDSSSYVQAAASGRMWGRGESLKDPSVTDQVHIALCNLAAATETPVPLSTTAALQRRFEENP
jgi:tRNA-guanine family transglycosylase